jgi:hypothetical protein
VFVVHQSSESCAVPFTACSCATSCVLLPSCSALRVCVQLCMCAEHHRLPSQISIEYGALDTHPVMDKTRLLLRLLIQPQWHALQTVHRHNIHRNQQYGYDDPSRMQKFGLMAPYRDRC